MASRSIFFNGKPETRRSGEKAHQAEIMEGTRHRHERVAEELLHEVSGMLAGELKDPRVVGLLTVMEVRVSPDLKHARVFISAHGTDAERASTRKGLDAAAGYVRRELTLRLQMRRAPEIHFMVETAGAQSERIDELLRKAQDPAGT